MPVALVTCADKAPGLTIAGELADRDMDVVLTARDPAAARKAAEHLWDEGLDTAHPRVLDASAPATIAKLRDRIAQDFGVLDVLVLCGFDADERAAVSAGLAHVLRADARVVVVVSDDPTDALNELAPGRPG